MTSTVADTQLVQDPLKREALPRLQILNAASGSPPSVHATAAAARLAASLEAELIVAHVAPRRALCVGASPRRSPSRGGWTIPIQARCYLRRAAVAWSNGALARIVLMDEHTVPALSRELGVDLLVIGAHASRALPVMTAPTRRRLQRQDRCPVMAVPIDCPAQLEPTIRPAFVT